MQGVAEAIITCMHMHDFSICVVCVQTDMWMTQDRGHD